MKKWVYSFGQAQAEGNTSMRNLLGSKGANLAEMCVLGLPVPPGFTITTDVCNQYYEQDKSFPDELKAQVVQALKEVERIVGSKFGDIENPLLFSVRSGARVSMPGMLDTVLNLGLNDQTVKGLSKHSNDARFAYDSYRRFIQMYSSVVLGLDHHRFEQALEDFKRDKDLSSDTDLSAEDWQDIIGQYKDIVERKYGEPFPQDVETQLWKAIEAVFLSWMNDRAKTYRRLNDISEEWGTAVNVQAMVFGNMGENCATGVAFTRDPSTGENAFYGEYLINAQGEDVVAGIRTPQSITLAGKESTYSDLPAMQESMPDLFAQLLEVRGVLENHYKDMQDIEFTIQKGQLYMLQTRSGKRTAAAALKIAVEMVQEGLVTKEEAILRLDPAALDQLLHPTIDPKAVRNVLTRGLQASPGAASGKIVFTAEEAERLVAQKEDVILCRIETSPDDIHGMHAACGILTSRGGMTSHAAVVARGMGRPCVSGAGEIVMDYRKKTLSVRGITLKEGDEITIDGSTGEVMLGNLPKIQPELSGDFATVMVWADSTRRLKIRANAETPLDSQTARDFGAEGIGLCRTEHMFFDPDRITAVRQMILARDETGRRAALALIEPMQRQDFIELFTIMKNLPVTVRLLDPPLHEFLPHTEKEMQALADILKVPLTAVQERVRQLHESNPMLGHRGCRLGITYPEIYEMQARAIFEAALTLKKDGQESARVEIMIPLIGSRKELDILKELVKKTAAAVFEKMGDTIDYLIGTMIELPRAALQAGAIAESAEFFSFGTNDLTQTTFGISRDDAATFLPDYKEKGIYAQDPFVSLDTEGVGELIRLAITRGQKTRPELKIGICGEHGGDPASIHFCEEVGLDYVSCSPYRVPIARLAAAQAALMQADK